MVGSMTSRVGLISSQLEVFRVGADRDRQRGERGKQQELGKRGHEQTGLAWQMDLMAMSGAVVCPGWRCRCRWTSEERRDRDRDRVRVGAEERQVVPGLGLAQRMVLVPQVVGAAPRNWTWEHNQAQQAGLLLLLRFLLLLELHGRILSGHPPWLVMQRAPAITAPHLAACSRRGAEESTSRVGGVPCKWVSGWVLVY